MAKQTFKRALVALTATIAIVCSTSCNKEEFEPTYVGIRYTTDEPGDIPPVTPSEGIEFETTEYVAQFDTTSNKLFTVEQKLDGEILFTENEEVVEREKFDFDLNLEVTLTAEPDVVYVDSEAKLSEVELDNNSASEIEEKKGNQGIFTLTSYEKDYEFIFNEGEIVNANAIWQSVDYKGGKFAYAEVKSVSYNRYDARQNNALSNADSTVFDINLYFNVEVECKKNSSVDATYEVRVPVRRIFVKTPEVIETVIENTNYVGEFDTMTNKLYTVKQAVEGEFVTYRNSKEIERNAFARDLNLEAAFTTPKTVYVDSERQLSAVAMTASSKEGDRLVKSNEGGFVKTARTQNYNFKFNEGEKISTATLFEKTAYASKDFEHSSIQNVRYNSFNAVKNELKSNVDSTVYDVILYFDVEVKRESVGTKSSSTSEVYSVEVPYNRVLMHEDVLVSKGYRDVKREIISSNTERVSFTEYEIWSNSGEKNARTIERTLSFEFSSPKEQTIITTNTNYETKSNGSVAGSETSKVDGNWKVYTKTNSYSSTADNGNKRFNNVYSYKSQKAVYTNEYYTVEFPYGKWSVKEGESNVGGKSGETIIDEIDYNVYPYVNNVTYVYDVTSDKFSSTGKSNADICIEKPVEKVIPESWGKILGAGISAVPSDDTNGDFAKKCLCIRTEKGAVAVVFGMDEKVPTITTINAGYFVEGEFGAEYNSGFYTTSKNKGSYELAKWAPATAKDFDNMIAYYQGNTCKRNVTKAVLQMWDWRDGNLSTKVDGYTFSTTSQGVLTVKFNGHIVMRIR